MENVKLHCLYVDTKISSLADNMVNQHFHPYYEVYYFLGDEMTFFLDNSAFTLKKHDIVFVDKFVYHKTFYDLNTESQRVNIAFHDAFLKENLTELQTAKILKPFEGTKRMRFQDEKTKHLFELLVHSMIDNHPSSCIGRSALITFLNELSVRAKQALPYLQEPVSKTSQIVSQIIDYINKHYKSSLSLDFLSDEFHISKYHLSRMFKQVAGIGFSVFLTEKRLTEAQRLLSSTDMSITEICGECGFDSMSNFLFQFEKYYYMSPRELRKTKRKVIS